MECAQNQQSSVRHDVKHIRIILKLTKFYASCLNDGCPALLTCLFRYYFQRKELRFNTWDYCITVDMCSSVGADSVVVIRTTMRYIVDKNGGVE